MKFAFAYEHRKRWPVAVSCRVLRVGRSGYYAWRKRRDQPPSKRLQRQQQLLAKIRVAHQANRELYGSPRVHRASTLIPHPVELNRQLLGRCRARWGVLLLLAYQFFLFNVVIPGHTRGAITLDGKHTGGGCRPCCCCDAATPRDRPSDSSDKNAKHGPSQRDKDNCAICNFAARVTPAPAISWKVPELRLLELLPLPAPPAAISLDCSPTYLGRGPPPIAL